MSESELLVARIISGIVRIRLANGMVIVKNPSREDRYIAQEIYLDNLESSRLDGSLTQETIIPFLKRIGVWDDIRQGEMEKLPRAIEDLKTKLVELFFRSNEREVIRRTLYLTKKKYQNLLSQRHSHDHLTCEGVATMARARFLLSRSCYYPSGRRVTNPEILEEALEEYLRSKLPDEEIRLAARTEPWSSIWSARSFSGSGIFGCSAADLTEEQLILVRWSQTYEQIWQHPECPGKEIVEDDDACDGWLIIKRRESEQAANKAAVDGVISNEKIRNSEEIFIVANTNEDIARIDSLNDEHAKAIKRQRERQIDERGAVQHTDLLDVRQYCQMESTRMRAEQIKAV